MPATPWFPVRRTLRGDYRDAEFPVPYSSLAPGTKFVVAPFVVPTMSATRRPGLAGGFQSQTFMQPPFFTRTRGMGDFTMPKTLDEAVAWAKDNALLVGGGLLALFLVMKKGRR